MHNHEGLSGSLQTGLGIYYFLVMLMNLGFAAYFHYSAKDRTQTKIWLAVAGVFFIHSFLFLFHFGWALPDALRDFINYVMNPVSYFFMTVAALIVFLRFRRFLTEPVVAWTILNVGLLFAGWAMTNPSFQAIIGKPDNVPIVLLIFSVGYFTWLAMRKAVINDARLERGEPPVEKLEDEKVLVWPDLVYTELIS